MGSLTIMTRSAVPIQLNGQKTTTTSSSIQDLIKGLGLPLDHVFVEHNHHRINHVHEDAIIQENDIIEIIQFVGGGASRPIQ